jgi:hypothetical protein
VSRPLPAVQIPEPRFCNHLHRRRSLRKSSPLALFVANLFHHQLSLNCACLCPRVFPRRLASLPSLSNPESPAWLPLQHHHLTTVSLYSIPFFFRPDLPPPGIATCTSRREANCYFHTFWLSLLLPPVSSRSQIPLQLSAFRLSATSISLSTS